MLELFWDEFDAVERETLEKVKSLVFKFLKIH